MTDRQNQSTSTTKGRPMYSMRELCSGDSLSNLIHKLVHEIDNPLTAIISIATVIQRSDIQTDAAFLAKLPSYSGAISKEAWRVSALAEKLLLLASTRRDNAMPCDANKVLRSVVAEALDIEEFADINVNLSLPESASIIECSQEQLTVLFRELILNSFTETAKTTKQAPSVAVSPVSLVLATTANELHFTTSNSTPRPKELPLSTLFEPFVTSPSRTSALGLGLTVAWGIVERAGGTIEIEESLRDGKCLFTTRVVLPRSSAQLGISETQTTSSETTAGKLDRALSVLIIEDEAMVASAMAKILELSFKDAAGALCTTVGGPEALALLKSGNTYDAILCDLNLKVTSGRHIFEFICNSLPELKPRFAFLTGDSLSNETSTYLKATGQPYLFKPFEPEQIVSLVRSLATAAKD